jgi:hypothetical protein
MIDGKRVGVIGVRQVDQLADLLTFLGHCCILT